MRYFPINRRFTKVVLLIGAPGVLVAIQSMDPNRRRRNRNECLMLAYRMSYVRISYFRHQSPCVALLFLQLTRKKGGYEHGPS